MFDEVAFPRTAKYDERWMAPAVALVNNAGIYPWKSFEDTDYETWRKVTSVNLDGAFLMYKAFVPAITAPSWK